jgi:cation:H+ antiporter
MLNVFSGSGQAGTMLLLGAAVLIYAVARSAVDLLNANMTSPGRLAIAHAVPLAAVAWTAAAMGQAELLLAVVMGTSLASLSVVIGVALTGPSSLQLPSSAKAWQFLLPVALLLLMMGFSAHLGLQEAAMLGLMGAAAAGVWNSDDTLPSAAKLPVDIGPQTTRDRLRPAQAALTLLLAGLAGWLAVRGSVDLATTRRGLSPGVIGLTLLSAMLILPHIGIATLLGQTRRVGIAAGAQIGTAFIALTFVLPIAIVIWHARGLVRSGVLERSQLADMFEGIESAPLPFPVGFWRIEGALLIAASLPLVPVAIGRWRPARAEGAALIFAYIVYLLIVTKAANRWH